MNPWPSVPRALALALSLALFPLGAHAQEPAAGSAIPSALEESSMLADGLGARPLESVIEEATRAHQASGAKLPVLERPSAVFFPYGHGTPMLVCAPLRACAVELEAGEIVLSTVLGDSVRWLVELASTGPGGRIPPLAFKPTACDLATNLIVSTDQRVYLLNLHAPGCDDEDREPALPFTPLLKYYYPDDVVRRWASVEQLERERVRRDAEELAPLAASPTELNFHYSWSGRRFPWRPAQVFDDGQRTYIKLPPEASRHELPVLFLRQPDGSTALLNYTARNGYFVTDRVLDRALLVLGDKRNRRELALTNLGKESAR